MDRPIDRLRRVSRQALRALAGTDAAAAPKAEAAVPPWLLPPPEQASQEDILACFRLLLGRNPHKEEWPGHSMRAGLPLPGVVASYVNSLEFSRRGLSEQNLTAGLTLTALPSFRIYSRDDDAAVGQHVRGDNYEADVTAVFRRFLRPGGNVIDIGANIGYFTMLSAAIVGPSGSVLAVEPNPRNVRLLEASRRANDFAHVAVAQVAAAAHVGLLVLHASYSNGMTSAPSDDLNMLLGSETVPGVPVDSMVAPDKKIDLIKLDVEGAEYSALLGCERTIDAWHPVVISEFSPDMMPNPATDGAAYLCRLIQHGYDLSVIEPDGSLLPAGKNRDRIMEVYRARGADHIDIVAT